MHAKFRALLVLRPVPCSTHSLLLISGVLGLSPCACWGLYDVQPTAFVHNASYGQGWHHLICATLRAPLSIEQGARNGPVAGLSATEGPHVRKITGPCTT